MGTCLLCEKKIEQNEFLFKLKKGMYSNYYAGFRKTGLEIHNKCLMKMLWNRAHSELNLQESTYEYLSMGISYKDDENFWKIGTYKINKMTQENIERIEANHYKKLAKNLLSE